MIVKLREKMNVFHYLFYSLICKNLSVRKIEKGSIFSCKEGTNFFKEDNVNNIKLLCSI